MVQGGTLHVASFSQGPDGFLAIELSPTETSLLDVAGNAALAGKLLVLPDPGGYQIGSVFVIKGEDPPEDFFLFGAGLSFHPNASDEVFIRYDGAWTEEDIHGTAISAGGKIRW